jgi:isopentenyl-diphosphate delta-isomerase
MADLKKNTAGDKAGGKRKAEHLRIALDEDIAFKSVSTGLEDYRFIHQALPEIDLDSVDLSTTLFGKKLAAPLIISPMVGGIAAAREVNRNLAQAARALGIGMGVGSQRRAIEDKKVASTYQVRDVAGDILLFANLGAVQLNNGYGVDECRRAVEMIGADALVLHLNPLQEALQTGGNTNFKGLLKKIEQVCRRLPVPVIVREVGFGISEDAARKLASAGVAAIDVSGAGGTSWSEVERLRSQSPAENNIAASFASWGIPTATSLQMAARGAPGVKIIASGGIRTGLDVAKAMALGADAAGMAAPLLKAASVSADAVIEALQEVIAELKICLFCLGASNLKETKNSPLLIRKTVD